jgi:preprotein translocase subunit YajC
MPQQAQTLILIVLMVAAFYFLIMRPQRKRQAAVQQTMRALGPGSRVLLNSGVFATVVAVGDRQATVEIAPGVEMTILKQAIARITTEADEDSDVDLDDEAEELENATEPDGLIEAERAHDFAPEPERPASALDLPPAESAPTGSAPIGSTTEADRDPNRPPAN